MVLPPSYLKTDADGMLHYFAEITEAVLIPIMVQDAPRHLPPVRPRSRKRVR
jgi:dihydrodipicolinate synthase/N-acetylneuraminate lyase